MLPSAFGMYRLDVAALKDVPVVLGGDAGQECRLSPGASTLGEAYLGLRDEKLLDESRVSLPAGKLVDPFAAEVTTACCKHTVAAPSWALDLLVTLLGLKRRGIEPFAAAWFPYAQSECLEEPQTCVRYFLVQNQTIVEDRVSLFAGPNDDVRYLAADTYSGPPVWSHEEAEADGAIRAWYRQFYETTHAGRTVFLRQDAPPLYGMERPPTSEATVTEDTRSDEIVRTIRERLELLQPTIDRLQYIMLAIAVVVTIVMVRTC